MGPIPVDSEGPSDEGAPDATATWLLDGGPGAIALASWNQTAPTTIISPTAAGSGQRGPIRRRHACERVPRQVIG